MSNSIVEILNKYRASNIPNELLATYIKDIAKNEAYDDNDYLKYMCTKILKNIDNSFTYGIYKNSHLREILTANGLSINIKEWTPEELTYYIEDFFTNYPRYVNYIKKWFKDNIESDNKIFILYNVLNMYYTRVKKFIKNEEKHEEKY